MSVEGRSQAKGLLTRSELIVEEELCINLRGRTQQCSACMDVCPADALELSLDRVDVAKEKCTGCNSCLPSCPAGALRSTGFVPERLLQAMSGKDTVHLHCRVSGDEGGGIIIPCHSVLDSRLLTAARAEGVTSIALHGLDRCAACKLGDARSHLQEVVSELATWLGEDAPQLDTSPEADRGKQRQYQDQPHMSRRTFLRFGGANTVMQAADWIVPYLDQEEEDVDALPFFQIEAYAQRSAQYQQVLVARAAQAPWRNREMLPFKQRTVTENCSGCLICGVLCPTGALHTGPTSSLLQLSFDPAICTDCGLCELICPEQAIQAATIGDLATLQGECSTLYFRQLSLCAECGMSFDPADTEKEICPVCNNEHDLDQEWLEILSG